MAKKPKRIMEDFTINEISAVDHPAQEGALRHIIKAKNAGGNMAEDYNKASVVDSISKRYIDPVEGAIPFLEALQSEMDFERYYDEIEQVRPYLYSLDTSLRSIAGDSMVDPNTKMTMMRNTVEDFMTLIRNLWSESEAVFMTAANKALEKETEEMAAKTQKQLQEELDRVTKENEELKAKVDKGTEGDEDQATLKAKIDELNKSLEALKAERDIEKAKAEMSDDEKEFMREMGKEERMRFMNLKPANRKKEMKKSFEDDEVLKVGERTIRKSVVGEDQFAIFKQQAEEMDSLRKQAETDREERVMAELTKRADSEFPNSPGTSVEKAKVLKAVEGLDDEVTAALTKMLGAGEKAISAAFNSFGHKKQQAETNGDDFMKRVTEVQNAEKVSRERAIQIARKRFPDEFTAYRQSA